MALRSHAALAKARVLGEAGVEQVFSSSHGLILSLIFFFPPLHFQGLKNTVVPEVKKGVFKRYFKERK